jgi:biotin carboxyl carrier protein
MSVTDLGNGRLRVDRDGRNTIVYVAGPAGRRWAFCNGHVLREEMLQPEARSRSARPGGLKELTAPMPATVLQVLASPGASVSRGETLVIVEAMKMELPLQAPDDGIVREVRCRAGELVQPEAILVTFE